MTRLEEMIYELEDETEQDAKSEELMKEVWDIKEWVESDLMHEFNDYDVEFDESHSISGGCFTSCYFKISNDDTSITLRLSDGHNNGEYSGHGSFDFDYADFVEDYNSAIANMIERAKKLIEEA